MFVSHSNPTHLSILIGKIDSADYIARIVARAQVTFEFHIDLTHPRVRALRAILLAADSNGC